MYYYIRTGPKGIEQLTILGHHVKFNNWTIQQAVLTKIYLVLRYVNLKIYWSIKTVWVCLHGVLTFTYKLL